MIEVRVPATSANLGPGFDTLGVALTLYNTFALEEIESGVEINILPDNNAGLSTGEQNLVYRAAKRLFDEVGIKCNGLQITITNGIPVGRGLGSSSTAIVGGLAAANELCGGALSKDDLFMLATEIEGHPDNVGPAIYGGFTICYRSEEGFKAVTHTPAETIKPILLVPSAVLETKKARGVLPETIGMEDAVFNISRTSLLVSAIINGYTGFLRDGMADMLHQPYRAPLIPGLSEIIHEAERIANTGIALSGAGPSMICLTEREYEFEVSSMLQNIIARVNPDYSVYPVDFDLSGATVAVL